MGTLINFHHLKATVIEYVANVYGCSRDCVKWNKLDTGNPCNVNKVYIYTSENLNQQG
jgi:hypothetical protein